jgi:hypothetical protein
MQRDFGDYVQQYLAKLMPPDGKCWFMLFLSVFLVSAFCLFIFDRDALI